MLQDKKPKEITNQTWKESQYGSFESGF
jgi:hypothetical protein